MDSIEGTNLYMLKPVPKPSYPISCSNLANLNTRLKACTKIRKCFNSLLWVSLLKEICDSVEKETLSHQRLIRKRIYYSNGVKTDDMNIQNANHFPIQGILFWHSV